MVAFSSAFSTTPIGKTMDGTQKKFAGWNDGTMQNLVEIERRTSAWEDEVWRFQFFL